MQGDALAALRDIHLPDAVTWWPPAPGWWFVAALLVLLLARAFVLWQQRRQRIRPLTDVRARYRALHDAVAAEHLSGIEFVHQTNELLKRCLIHVLKMDQAIAASGDDWLSLLDGLMPEGAVSFAEGAGRILGEERFRRDPRPDVDGLDLRVRTLLDSVRPR